MKLLNGLTRSETGFGMVEVVIAGALVSVIGLGIGTLIVDMQKGQKHIQQLNSALDLSQAISALLSDPVVCRRNFGSTATAPAAQRSFDNATLTTDLINASGSPVYDVASTKSYGDGNFTITSYSLRHDSVINATTPATILGTLVVNFEKANPGTSNGPRTLRREIGMQAVLTGAVGSSISTCHSLGVGKDLLWALAADGTSIFNTSGGKVGIGEVSPNYPLQVAGAGPAQYGATPQIFANGDNHTGGGIRISDDGGFFDYNDSWVTYNGFSGLRIAGSSGPSSIDGRLVVNGKVGVGLGFEEPVAAMTVAGNTALAGGSCIGFNRNPDDGSLPPLGNAGHARFQLTPRATRLDFEAFTSAGSPQGGFSLGQNGRVGIGNTSPPERLFVDGNVGVSSGNGFVYTSDQRLKRDFTRLDGLEIIKAIGGYTFTWKNDGSQDVGVIAQEIEKVVPTAVHTRPDGMRSVDYPKLVAPLIEAIKEQQQQIDALRAEIEMLKLKTQARVEN